MKHHLFLTLLLSTRTIARTASSAPPHPATGLLSRDSSTVYLFMPSSTSELSTDFRFVSLRLNATFSAENISSAFTELPHPPSHDRNPETQVSITPLLFSNPSSAGEGILDEKVVIFSGSCDSEVAIYEYNLTDNKAGWKARDVVPADGLGRLDIDINSLPLPKGRYYGRAFAYSIATTISTIAPSSTFMKGQSREGDDALKEYEQGVVVTTSTESKAFMFGGQCPTFSSRGDEGTWSVSRAMYSGSMLAVEFPISRTFAFSPGKQKGASPTMHGSNNPNSLSAVLSENNGHGSYGEWPIPEAGFSLTTIPTDDTSMNVVIIGGHTEKAFVDMRQVAVYQVPEGRWKFADVELPKAAPPKLSSSSTRVATDPRPTTETETTREDPSTAVRAVQRRQEEEVKDTRRIDPRSGHTAVATKDGKRVIVYGGWVGNVNTPAEPRLIVLELVGDVGKENWRWEIPYTRSGELGPPTDGEDEGLSGHAAVMLEGDVMMIISGYRISPFTNASEVSDKSFFYNVTSASWISTYKPAHVLAAEIKDRHDCDRARRTTGIVLGVVFSIAALAAVVVGYFWYFRKGKRGQDAEKAIYSRPLERERWGSFGFYGKPSASEERLGTFGFYNHSGKPSASQERMVGGGPYGSSAKSMAMSQERVGIVETRSHSYRVLGDDGSRSGTPDGPQRTLLRGVSMTTSVPRPPPKAVLKTNPARVSTIFEAEEYDRRSSCGATVGSDDLAELYSRSLAFAEKMAVQETIYEQSRSRSGTPSDEWSDTSHRHVLPRPPPRAALSSESLMSLPMAPSRIPYAHSFPLARTVPPTPKIRTLLTPARFFPIPTKSPVNRRVVSLSHGTPSPPMTNPSSKQPKRWSSISALRNALPDILPTSPISLWENGISRGGKNTSRSSGSGSDTLSIPIALDATLLGSEGGVRFSVGDEDWDLEAAIEKRVVQVMFTAPKGALRVVNLDERGVIEQESEEQESEGVEVKEGYEEEEVVEEIVVRGQVKEEGGEEEGEIVIEMREEVMMEMTCQ